MRHILVPILATLAAPSVLAAYSVKDFRVPEFQSATLDAAFSAQGNQSDSLATWKPHEYWSSFDASGSLRHAFHGESETRVIDSTFSFGLDGTFDRRQDYTNASFGVGSGGALRWRQYLPGPGDVFLEGNGAARYSYETGKYGVQGHNRTTFSVDLTAGIGLGRSRNVTDWFRAERLVRRLGQTAGATNAVPQAILDGLAAIIYRRSDYEAANREPGLFMGGYAAWKRSWYTDMAAALERVPEFKGMAGPLLFAWLEECLEQWAPTRSIGGTCSLTAGWEHLTTADSWRPLFNSNQLHVITTGSVGSPFGGTWYFSGNLEIDAVPEDAGSYDKAAQLDVTLQHEVSFDLFLDLAYYARLEMVSKYWTRFNQRLTATMRKLLSRDLALDCRVSASQDKYGTIEYLGYGFSVGITWYLR